ncbi:MAG TPA: hypothetical protein VM659_18040, partial [Dongiaceae bacterium]|nr:hypothetical protein [Dongiaceae bacterium]
MTGGWTSDRVIRNIIDLSHICAARIGRHHRKLRSSRMASWQKILYESAIVWDAHACLPLEYNADMSPLERHRKAGATFVSVNVGMDFNPLGQVIRVIAGFRDWLSKHSDH